jgi:hypothetical protein
MPLPIVSVSTPTIRDIWLYTYKRKETRFYNMDRDILPSRILVTNKLVYKKNKEGKYSTPDEKLSIVSYSAPQYGEYLRGKRGVRQMKVKHNYDVTFSLQKDPLGEYSLDSKILFRVGSYRKWNPDPPQSKIKTIKTKTRIALKKKFTNKSGKLDRDKYSKALELIRKRGKYLSTGDYNSQALGLNGDFYFRQMPLLYAQGCLFGPLTQREFNKDEKDTYPFFGKHELGVIMVLLKKGVLKK